MVGQRVRGKEALSVAFLAGWLIISGPAQVGCSPSVASLARDGEIGRACLQLTSTPLREQDPEARAALRQAVVGRLRLQLTHRVTTGVELERRLGYSAFATDSLLLSYLVHAEALPGQRVQVRLEARSGEERFAPSRGTAD